MQNGLCIRGAGKELEEPFSIFWSSVSLFPPNTQQKMKVMNPLVSKDEEFLNRLKNIKKERQKMQDYGQI